MKKTTEIFSKQVKDMTDNEYELISEYINNKTKVKLLHKKCNNIYEVRPDRFIQGDRCPYCSKVKNYTTEEYKEKVKLMTNEEYEFIDEYKNNNTKSKYRHNKCNKECITLPSNVNNCTRCPYCSHSNKKKTIEELKEEIYNQVKDEYTLISTNYINNKSKLIFKHNVCNKEFSSNADNFLNRKRRCPHCKRSKGEEKIAKWLDDNNIEYETQYKIPDCKYKRVLPFDFKLNINGKMILIEYDGEQHEKGYFIYNEENFNLQKKRDQIKDDYCKTNNIELYRISYKDFDNIESILNNIINKGEKIMRWNTESFKKEVERNEGYILLSEYTGCHNKVKIKHTVCGNEYEVTPTNFLAGTRCPKCAILEHNREIARKKKNKSRTTESFKKEIKDLVGDEYTLIDEYINTETPIKIRHNICGCEYLVRPYNFLHGKRCPKCSKEISSEKHKIGIEETKKRVEEVLGEEYEVLLKQPYVNNNTKIKVYHTKCGQLFEATPNNLFNGRGCSHCKKSEKYTTETYQKALGDSYTVLSEYINNKSPITVRHNKCGYEWTARALDILHPWTRGNKEDVERCPKCNKTLGISYGEKEVLSYLKDDLKIENIIENDRSILNGKEIDIYLPDLKLAIEFDGLYWHSEEFVDKNYHLNKTNECKNKGIQLIHLMEDEWVNKKDLIKDKLKYMTHNINQNIYARKCYIEEISADMKNKFLDEYHIQGKDTSNIKLGLWYPDNKGDILVAVMTFCKPRLSLGQKNNKNKIDYELSRYATARGFNVVGGFSKLFKYFERNYEWNRIITYADLRWSIGNLYLKNGFELDHISAPSYSYIDKNNIKRYNRFKFRKQELKKLFPDIYDDNKTEFQIMKEAGYFKIYDCGNMVFYYNR